MKPSVLWTGALCIVATRWIWPGAHERCIRGRSIHRRHLLSRVRVEEKLLLTEFERRGVNVVRFDDRHLQLDLLRPSVECDVVIERCINHLRALYTLKVLNDWGVPTVNTYEVANTCGDKLLTTTALVRDGVPSPRTIIAFTPKRRWMRLKRSATRWS